MNEINWNECKSNSFILVDRTEIHLDQPEYVIRLLVRTMSKLSKRWWGGAVVTAGRGGSCSEKRQTQKRQELFVSVAEIDKQLGRSTGRKMRQKKKKRRHLPAPSVCKSMRSSSDWLAEPMESKILITCPLTFFFENSPNVRLQSKLHVIKKSFISNYSISQFMV